jgi:multidrug efflux pump subunit AcrA (membrane-fusion protein)
LAGSAVLMFVTACSGGDSGVTVAAVSRGDVTEVVEAPATVTARASVSITAPATGRIAELDVKDGQRVTAGHVLVVIDSPQARQQLADAQRADAQAAQAAVVDVPTADLSAQQARADAAARQGFEAARQAAALVPDRAARLQAFASLGAAQAQYAAARAQAQDAVRQFNAGIGSLASALASLSQAQRVQTRAAVSVAQRTVDSLVVHAPISGYVSLGGGPASIGSPLSGAAGSLPQSLQDQANQLLGGSSDNGAGSATRGSVIAVGTPVRSGDSLVTITDVSSLSLTAEVDETDVLLVSPGVEADVELDAVPGATYPATVTAVDLTPTTSSRGGVGYVVRLGLSPGTAEDGEPAPTPRPGMSAVADLRVRTAKDVVSVPAAAVFRDGTRDAVWVEQGGTAHKRHVRVGAQGEDRVEVQQGLTVGELVVVRGADRVREGQRL